MILLTYETKSDIGIFDFICVKLILMLTIYQIKEYIVIPITMMALCVVCVFVWCWNHVTKKLSGNLPTHLDSTKKLILALKSNHLTGVIPTSFVNLRMLMGYTWSLITCLDQCLLSWLTCLWFMVVDIKNTSFL